MNMTVTEYFEATHSDADFQGYVLDYAKHLPFVSGLFQDEASTKVSR